MINLIRLTRRYLEKITMQPTDAELRVYCDRDPWILGCAVMADQRSDGMSMGFDMWWQLSARNWVRDVRKGFPLLTEGRLRAFLVAFVLAHRHQHYTDVLRDAAIRSGVPATVSLGPGESIELSFTIALSDEEP